MADDPLITVPVIPVPVAIRPRAGRISFELVMVDADGNQAGTDYIDLAISDLPEPLQTMAARLCSAITQLANKTRST